MKIKGLFSLIGIIICFIASLLITFFQVKNNITLKKQLLVKNIELEKAQEANQRLAELEHKLQALKQKERQLNKIVPPGEKEPLSLIKSIIRLGADIKLSLKSFTLKREEVKAVVKKTNPQKSSPKATAAIETESGIRSLPLEVKFEATFPQVTSFLVRLKGLERLVDVTDVTMKRIDKILPRQEVTLKLVTYTSAKE